MVDVTRNRHQDRAIDSAEADLLDRGPFADSLIRALVTDKLDDAGKLIGRHSTGYVVGLTGQWGSGKSSVLNLIEKKLDVMDHVVVAVFNPWLFSGRDELVTGFFNALRSALGSSNSEDARKLLSAIDRYWGAINLAGHGVAAIIDISGASGAATAAWKTWIPCFKNAIHKEIPTTPEKEKESLEKKIKELNWSVVVLIDELDRVEDDEVRAVAQLIKAVGDIKGISYLVSYDPDRVSEALGKGDSKEARRKSGERYIEKIIQHPIPLRPLFTADKEALLKDALSNCNTNVEPPQTDSQSELQEALLEAIQTPRDIKRLIGAFSILEKSVRGEICPYDLLGYCWIMTKSPSLRDNIASNIDQLVNDPSAYELSRRLSRRISKEEKLSINKILGDNSKNYQIILHHLFPRFDENYIDSELNGDRICKRRNLVRLLYLGNPPGTLRHFEIEKLWNSADLDRSTKELRQFLKDGMLPEFLDRLDDQLASLSPSGDQVFWLALSRALTREHDWLLEPENAGAMARDSAQLLRRLAKRDENNKIRLRAVLKNLIDNEDLVLVPLVLRQELFSHGLTNHSETPRGGEILSLLEIKTLIATEINRYKSAIADGYALKRLPHFELFYTLLNCDEWGPYLKHTMTNQLNSFEAITTIAALTVPPGQGTPRSTFDEFFDVEKVLTKIKSELDGASLSDSTWIENCLQRFIDVLEGRSYF